MSKRVSESKQKTGRLKRFMLAVMVLATAGTLLISFVPTAPAYAAPGDTKPDCESSLFSLNWIFCGIYNSISGATDWVFTNLIENQLRTPLVCTNASGNCTSGTAPSGANAVTVGPNNTQIQSNKDPTMLIWSSFRIYGDAFLLIALLVIVFGESIGGGLIDAYTVKKVLPRLLIAAVLINLSIYIVAFAVDVSNIVGNSIGALITSPLSDNKAFTIKPQGGVGAGALFTGGIVAGFMGAGKIGALFSVDGLVMLFDIVLVPALLVMIAIFATIAVRKAILLALIYLSPVAFAMYALPNTERYFKRWWKVFQEMLVIYPIIVLFFAISDVMSVTVNYADKHSAVNYILSFIFLILPLFLIPFSFKFAGGVVGQIHDFAQGGRAKISAMGQNRRDSAKMRFGAQAAAIDHRNAQRREALVGDRFQGTVGSRIPIVGSRAVQGRLAKTDVGSQSQVEAIGKSAGAQAIMNDPSALRAAHGRNYNEARNLVLQDYVARNGGDWNALSAEQRAEAEAEATRAAAAVQKTIGFGGAGDARTIWANQALAREGTGIRDIQDQTDLAALAAGNNAATLNSIVGASRAGSKQAGRPGLSASHGLTAAITASKAAGRNTVTHNGQTVSMAEAERMATEEGWNSADLYTHAHGKRANLQSAVDHYTREINSGEQERQDRALVFFRELQQMQPNTTGEIRNLIDETLNDHAGGGTLAVQVENLSHQQLINPNGNVPVTRNVTHPVTGVVTPVPVMRTEAPAVNSRVRAFQRPDPNNI